MSANTYQPYALGNSLGKLGYECHAFHNHSYEYYSRDKSHPNFGYDWHAVGNWDVKFTSAWPKSDKELALNSLSYLSLEEPFHLYYMTVSGHAYQTFEGNRQAGKHRAYVTEVLGNDYKNQLSLSFIACQYEVELMVKELYDECERLGILEDTVFVLAPDHFPYGLDSGGTLGNMPLLSELYGYNVENYFQRDHSRLILWCGSLEENEPIVVDTPTFSLDILPTLSNLFGTEFDSRLFVGRDVFSDATPLVFNTHYDWKTDLGTYYASSGKFVANEGAEIPENYVQNIKTQVRNKMRYCSMSLSSDYFRYLFEKK